MADVRRETDSLGVIEVPADRLWGAQTQRSLEDFGIGRDLMLVTALAPVVGYDKASKIAHYAMDNDLTLKAAALRLGIVTEAEFDRVVDPAKMVHPYVAQAG
jgi:fumarate hydratase, class II